MSGCKGLHCDGCGSGAGIKATIIGGAVVVAVGAEVLEWVAAHAIELALVTAVCFGIAIATVAALFRLAGRRDARHAAERPFLIVRDQEYALPAASRPEIAPVINVNIFTADAEASAAAIIRNALTEGGDYQ